MNVQGADEQAILARIERLERENAWIKRVCAAVLLMGATLFLMGQAKQGSTAWQKQIRVDKVQARTIELFTPEGNLTVKLGGSPLGGSELIMFDGNRKARVSLDSSAPLLQMGKLEIDNTGHVSLCGGGKGTVRLGYGSLILSDEAGRQTASLGASDSEAVLTLISDTPRLLVGKPNDYRTEIGSTDLLIPSTGETHRTSAASVVLFDKNGKVIWSAP
jgi:hypothetical protein